MPKIILGIDPGIADTGYGVIVVDRGKARCLAYGSIRTESGLDLSVRLVSLHEQLEKIIEEFHPDISAMEELFFSKNVRTAIMVGQARGVSLFTISRHGIPVFHFKPSQVKQAVASYGQATKIQVQKMVKMILGLEDIPKPDDAADALAIALCAINCQICKKD
jgi:crossover junction endodeoxyribonuclease RuvC